MRQEQFLEVVDRDEAERRFRAALGELRAPASERVAIGDALGRVLGENVVSAVDVPGFDRANLDGFAVRAEDTFGATEAAARELRLAGTSVHIGALAARALAPGEAMSIPTGGALPRGADAIVMVEWTELDGDVVRVRRAVTPGHAVTYAGTDIAQGETLMRTGQALTSREIGVLAAVGRSHVEVRQRPRIAVLSTGDELVSPGEPIAPGQVFDANRAIVAAAVRECGALPVELGIAPDDEDALATAVRNALASCDGVVLSGGTSKGPGDLAARALARALEPPGIVVHGVALKPGKPLCLAVSAGKPVVVLPGFPTSAIFTFHDLVAPVLRELSGLRVVAAETVNATLPMRVRSEPGRREYNLVHLVEGDAGELLAYPIGKGSGSITTWSQADGYFVVPRNTEHVPANARVVVHPIAGARPNRDDLVVIGSHCVGLDVILGVLMERGISSKVVAVGSEGGLAAAKRGACDIAPVHLLDRASGAYNRPFLIDGLSLVEGYGRLQGVVFRKGDPRFEGKAATGAVRDAATRSDIVMINRNRGSGTRALYDQLLGDARPAGHAVEASSHNAVAAAVDQGRADFGIAIDVVAAARGLGFLPLTEERFDFVVPASRRERPAVAAFIEALGDGDVKNALRARGFRL